MFTLTIRSRDFVPFTISGEMMSLMTAVTIFKSGLQARQEIIMTLDKEGVHAMAKVPTVHNMDLVLESLFPTFG
jgi:hypothetical protein